LQGSRGACCNGAARPLVKLKVSAIDAHAQGDWKLLLCFCINIAAFCPTWQHLPGKKSKNSTP
ncbi:MAG: hypothetical protein RSE54_09475, partial [Ruthenibacterium sp.]